MIRDVDYLDIKTMHKAGMTTVDIGLKIGYSDKTVRKWIKRDTPPRYTRKPRPSKLDPYKEYIMGRMHRLFLSLHSFRINHNYILLQLQYQSVDPNTHSPVGELPDCHSSIQVGNLLSIITITTVFYFAAALAMVLINHKNWLHKGQDRVVRGARVRLPPSDGHRKMPIAGAHQIAQVDNGLISARIPF